MRNYDILPYEIHTIFDRLPATDKDTIIWTESGFSPENGDIPQSWKADTFHIHSVNKHKITYLKNRKINIVRESR